MSDTAAWMKRTPDDRAISPKIDTSVPHAEWRRRTEALREART